MNLTPIGSRFRRASSGLMRSHLAPCRPLRTLRFSYASAARVPATVATATVASGPVAALATLEPRRV